MIWKKMSENERRLAKSWYVEDGEKPAEIARRLGRDKSTVTRLLIKRAPRKTQGRKPILTEAQVDRLEKRLQTLVQKANGQYQVTVDRLRKSARCKAGTRTILKKSATSTFALAARSRSSLMPTSPTARTSRACTQRSQRSGGPRTCR